ncbi:ankyrin repeat domain-containing protein [Chromatiaceae bacterium AAb-1]|nr:ankyrin repeat domain-containing protein [Chromatiaceae bacterium AAb-1]
MNHLAKAIFVFMFLIIGGCSYHNEPDIFLHIKSGDLEAVRKDVKEEGIFEKTNLKGITPLIYAIEQDNLAAFRLMLENGADPNHRISSGGSAMTFSIANDDPTYLRLLIEFGGDANFFHESRRESVIFSALSPGKQEHLKILFNAGADINARDGVNRTPIMVSGVLNQYETVLYLLKKGADCTLKDNFNYTLRDILRDNQFMETDNMMKLRFVILDHYCH